ncbi:MAG: DoxX family protein [Bacteroidota bacterium]
MKTKSILDWGSRIIAALILLQTLFFKFTAHPDSVLLFSTLGVEPFGRVGLGIAELIVAVLLLVPRTAWLGAIGAIGLMIGAIGTHVFLVGINFNNDGGTLFALAVVTFTAASLALYLHRNEVQDFLAKFGVLKPAIN